MFTCSDQGLIEFMKFVVKLYPEIMIKSKSVRMRFVKLLEGNIRSILRKVDDDVSVQKQWDCIEVHLKKGAVAKKDQMIKRLACIPGIQSFSEVTEFPFVDLDQTYLTLKDIYEDTLANKTFCVRVKRKGSHDFTSMDAERYIGGGLNQNTQAKHVSLRDPDVEIKLEINNEHFLLSQEKNLGLGGFPIATQEDVLSLMSGGYDSAVSSYHMIKKGARTHYCFFNLGGSAHEIGVKQLSYYLWKEYGESHKVRFISVPFELVVEEILERIESGLMGVVLKRMMVRIAEKIAERFNIQSLVTGESLGQVSSQTLTNLNVIDRACETLILRPLISTDKQVIIDEAKRIGTASISETMPEYCGVISKSPTVKAVLSKVEEEEKKFSDDLIERVLERVTFEDIRDIVKQAEEKIGPAQETTQIDEQSVVLDIRAPEEQEHKPLEFKGTTVQVMPFYKLGSQFATLDSSKEYLLYCERGVMSQLQALYLQEQGHTNVKVLKIAS